MSVSWDFNTATLVAIALQIVAVIVFLVRTHSKAHVAYEAANKAQFRADEAHASLATLSAAFGLFREHVAAEYVDRDAIREMEQRLTDAINRLGDRFDAVLHRKT